MTTLPHLLTLDYKRRRIAWNKRARNEMRRARWRMLFGILASFNPSLSQPKRLKKLWSAAYISYYDLESYREPDA